MEFTKQLDKVESQAADLKDAFLEIQQPRSNYALKHFVVGEYDTAERQYMQVVEELRRAYHMIKLSLLEKKKALIEIDQLKEEAQKVDPFSPTSYNAKKAEVDIEMKELNLEELDACILGKLREFDCLYAIFKSYPKFTHKALEEAEENYWRLRLSRQAAVDMATHGGVGPGNLEAMRQIGMAEYPTLQVTDKGVGTEVKFNLNELNKRDFSKLTGVPKNGKRLTSTGEGK